MYRSLGECVQDLDRAGRLLRIKAEVDPKLEMAEIHRQVFADGGPAVYFERIKGSPFPAVSNLFGTIDRARFLFRDTLPKLKNLFRLKADPAWGLRNPSKVIGLIPTLWHALPQRRFSGPVQHRKVALGDLPQIVSWPEDGGPYVLQPQVYSEDPRAPSIFRSNVGMYRVQLAGGSYEPGKEVGLHYQIRRDIGIHHRSAVELGQPLPVSVFCGGPPAHPFSAVMFLPEKISEVLFAGMLAGRGFRYARIDGNVISLDSDFCIVGEIDPNQRQLEGPFGDHLGYYSLAHPFPVMKVKSVYARKDAIWHFTVVGRPPQEDSIFGQLIQEIAGPVIKTEIPGIHGVHAVDAAGVHPLLLASGRETFTPHDPDSRPAEILKLAHALLGYGPCALAKYLLIVAEQDLDLHDLPGFFRYLLERIDWRTDLHFETETTVDTLDYSGTEVNRGSKVVFACGRSKRRTLTGPVLSPVTGGNQDGAIVTVGGPKFSTYEAAEQELIEVQGRFADVTAPLVILCDDPEFTAATFANFLWVAFTRSDPARDIYGFGSFTKFKHWGCTGSLIIDARVKPHHAPELVVPSEIVARAKKIVGK